MHSDSLVIIPTYNERENIAQMIDTVFALPHAFHLLVVDDGSPDGTATIVREKQAEYPEASVIRRSSCWSCALPATSAGQT